MKDFTEEHTFYKTEKIKNLKIKKKQGRAADESGHKDGCELAETF